MLRTPFESLELSPISLARRSPLEGGRGVSGWSLGVDDLTVVRVQELDVRKNIEGILELIKGTARQLEEQG
jgi:hypothetical protein